MGAIATSSTTSSNCNRVKLTRLFLHGDIVLGDAHERIYNTPTPPKGATLIPGNVEGRTGTHQLDATAISSCCTHKRRRTPGDVVREGSIYFKEPRQDVTSTVLREGGPPST